jgi:hypothetical protein
VKEIVVDFQLSIRPRNGKMAPIVVNRNPSNLQTPKSWINGCKSRHDLFSKLGHLTNPLIWR